MRSILGMAVTLLLAVIVAAPPLALALRGMPGVALASSLAAGASVVVVAWARHRRLPLELTTLLLLPPAVAWGFGEGFGFFARIPIWDVVAHFVAGLAIGALATPFLLAHLREGLRRRAAVALLGALGWAALAGSLWEAVEWASDTLLGSRTLGTAGDTVGDLGADMAGALVGGAAVLYARRRLPAREKHRLGRPFRQLARTS